MSCFGENLRKNRNEKGLTQDELASLLGTSKQVISRYENDLRSPKVSVVADYAEKLGVSIDELTISHKDGKLFFFFPEDDSQSDDYVPQTPEARIVSGGMDKLPEAQRQQILGVVRAMFANDPDLFKDGDDK